MLNGIYDYNVSHDRFFQKDIGKRRHSAKLFKKRYRLNVMTNIFSHRMVDTYEMV